MTSKKSKSRSPLTAAEFLAELAKDDEFVQRERNRVEKAEARGRNLARQEAPLVAALSNAGVEVRSVYDLVMNDTPAAAIPILWEHLHKDYDVRILEGIARAMATPLAAPFFEELLEDFLRAPQSDNRANLGLKYAIALAVGNSAKGSQVRRLIPLAEDENLGDYRTPLVAALVRSSDPEAQAAVRRLHERGVLDEVLE